MRQSTYRLLSKEDQEILGELDRKTIPPKVWQHAEHPRNNGILEHPDGQSEVTGICEDTIGFQLRVRSGVVDGITFQADGCGFTLACGSMATELARGKPVREALEVTGEQIQKALGGLPRNHVHCADLAANALKAALLDALEKNAAS